MYNRKIIRNMFKSAQGNNRIQRAWRRFQVKKYGRKKWESIYICCNSGKKPDLN